MKGMQVWRRIQVLYSSSLGCTSSGKLRRAKVEGVPNRWKVCKEDKFMLGSIVKPRQDAFPGHGRLQVLGTLTERHQL